MRIHIEIPPSLLSPFTPPVGPSDPNSPIFARIGGNIVLLELQGTLQAEGDKDGQLIGKLGMEGDRPTLRIAHHLLHGVLVNLPKPLAVLRKAPSKIDDELEGIELPSDDASSSSDDDEDAEIVVAESSPMPGPNKKGKNLDYSSDIDPYSSSPVKQSQPQPQVPSSTPGTNTFKRKRPLSSKGKKNKKKNRKDAAPALDEVARTTKYECVGVVKLKVVFSKRPQPVVNLDAVPAAAAVVPPS
ncbi:hypothetical protein BDY24DRAFT_412020 [Mrakia frigida]|uniref:uncharacterized protein n=1 Tax=Mrakia frigida TaxID=29902 RepID=UPI003FCC1758